MIGEYAAFNLIVACNWAARCFDAHLEVRQGYFVHTSLSVQGTELDVQLAPPCESMVLQVVHMRGVTLPALLAALIPIFGVVQHPRHQIPFEVCIRLLYAP